MKLNPKFTRGEYWILNSVVESATPICWLDWEYTEEALNRSAHGMNRKLLKDTFLQLFKRKLIEVHISRQWDKKISLTPEKLDAALDEKQHPECLYYRLSAKGGLHWEAFAMPNWSYYIYDSYSGRDENGYERGELICYDQEIVKRYFYSLNHQTFHIEDSSISWNLLQPWKATYWKELPKGHSVKFKILGDKTQKHKEDPVFDTFDKDHYDALWCEWR